MIRFHGSTIKYSHGKRRKFLLPNISQNQIDQLVLPIRTKFKDKCRAISGDNLLLNLTKAEDIHAIGIPIVEYSFFLWQELVKLKVIVIPRFVRLYEKIIH